MSTQSEIDSALERLREEVAQRPYVALAAAVGIGWLIARRAPAGALAALLGVGARAVMAAVAENALRTTALRSR